MNNAPVVVGKKSAASKAKDNQLLASLGGGIVTLEGSKMVKSVVATGQYKGKPMGSLLTKVNTDLHKLILYSDWSTQIYSNF